MLERSSIMIRKDFGHFKNNVAMKKLITVLLLVLSITSYSQTQLDKEIFRLINEYRISNDLTAWVWSQDAFNVAEKHNLYQVQRNKVTHKGINNSGSRDRLTAGNVECWASGENLAKIYSATLSLAEIAARTVQVWINSKPHHELLLYNCCFIYGSISSKVTTNKKWTYVTLNIYG